MTIHRPHSPSITQSNLSQSSTDCYRTQFSTRWPSIIILCSRAEWERNIHQLRQCVVTYMQITRQARACSMHFPADRHGRRLWVAAHGRQAVLLTFSRRWKYTRPFQTTGTSMLIAVYHTVPILLRAHPHPLRNVRKNCKRYYLKTRTITLDTGYTKILTICVRTRSEAVFMSHSARLRSYLAGLLQLNECTRKKLLL